MIEILLPVYNGEKYLAEQIESIIAQTNHDWVIKIRNDGSSDNSHKVIKQYCERYPEKIINIDLPESNIGLVQSLNKLYEAEPHGDYIMFADQDDFWLPTKIEKCLSEAIEMERGNHNMPVMVCTDAKCVDQDLNVIDESFFESQKFPENIIGNVNKMAALNIVQGCTIMINKVASKYIFPMPLIMSIHDMWIALNCAYFGRVKYLKEPTILYRQHTSNVAGKVRVNSKYYLNRISHIKNTLTFIFKLNKNLKFNLNIPKVLFYKIIFMINRL